MAAGNEISFEVSPKMGMVLASCFEMVGLSTPYHISSDKMALVLDRIDKTRRLLKKKLLFTTEENSGKVREIGKGIESGMRMKTDLKEQQQEQYEEKLLKQTISKIKLDAAKKDKLDEQTKIEVSTQINCIEDNFIFPTQKNAIVASDLGVMRSQIKILLKQEGYRVYQVNSIKELLFVLQNNEFDLVVTEMKELKDLKSIAKIRSMMRYQDKLAVISSELKNIVIRNVCKKIGVNVYIEKVANWHKVMLYKLERCGDNQLKYA